MLTRSRAEVYAFLHRKLHNKPDALKTFESEPNNGLDAKSKSAHLAESRKCGDAGSGGLRGWRIPGESGAVRHWDRNRRLRKRPGAHREVDRPSRQQRRRIRG